ncbi:hypothetical protein GPK34_01420 [Secundilactobacillus kimchicus]|uniref:hypothetical protein n=1 Tax=Secundilactobacillus kimchicus TaxID=528209 RepID=UPI001C013C59|nr:hypothetical protein [Secundilactobacillus kimchicus]MBT9670698.1 hypothetical protein [Secundilactobacillus kimchicus]
MFIFTKQEDNFELEIGIILDKVCSYINGDDPDNFGVFTTDAESFTVPIEEFDRFKSAMQGHTDHHVF